MRTATQVTANKCSGCTEMVLQREEVRALKDSQDFQTQRSEEDLAGREKKLSMAGLWAVQSPSLTFTLGCSHLPVSLPLCS